MKNKKIYPDVVAALLVLLFSYTAASKFLDYDSFVFQMRLAPLPLMRAMAPVLGWLTPIIESVLVAGLMTARWRPASLALSVALLSIFELYIGGMLLSGKALPCTCGGIISTMKWDQHLVFNAFFILLGLSAIFVSKKIRNGALSADPDHHKDFMRA